MFMGEQCAVGVRAVHPAGFDRGELHPPGFGEHDAGAAEGGYGFGFIPNGLYRFADGRFRSSADLDAVEQHDHRAGGDDLFDSRHRSHCLAVRDPQGCPIARPKRVVPAEI